MPLLQPLVVLLAQAWRVSSASSAASASLWTTAQGAKERMAKQADVKFEEDFEFDGPTIGISGRRGQSITGFGSAFTEAAASVFAELPTSKQEQLLQLLFGPDGIGFTLGRVHINSCDFSLENYDFDAVDGDVDLVKFDSNVTHDQKQMIPLIVRAQEVLKSRGQKLSLLASPWSPPAWMKKSGKMDGSDNPCLKDGMRPTWAKYISKWISAYQHQGVPIWAITVQNEPAFAAPWEACKWSKEAETEFVGKDLGPTLRKDHPDVKIFGWDHNKDAAFAWAETLFGDSTAAPFLTGIGLHWYSGDMFDQVAKIHNKFPDAVILGTEATFEKGAWDAGDTMMKEGKWSFGEGYAHDIMGDLNAGATGWIDWNMALDKNGGPNHVDNVCDAAVIVNGQDFYVHPQLYYMGHFSKWAVPGSEYIETYVLNSESYSGEGRGYGTCTSSDGLQAASFMRPDEQVALVVLNCGDKEIKFKIHAGDKAARATIPAHAIQTYLISRSGDAAPPAASGRAGSLADDGVRFITRKGSAKIPIDPGKAAAAETGGAGAAPDQCTYFNSGDGASACPLGSEMVTEAECKKSGPLNDPFYSTSDSDPSGCFTYLERFYWNRGGGGGLAERRLRCKTCVKKDSLIWALFGDSPGLVGRFASKGGLSFGTAVLLAMVAAGLATLPRASAAALRRRLSRPRQQDAADAAPPQAAALTYAPLV